MTELEMKCTSIFKRVILFTYALLLIPTAGTCSDAFAAPGSIQADSLIVSGMELIFHEYYDKADSLFNTVVERKPDHPIGHFFKGLVTWRRSYIIKDYKSFDKAIKAHFSMAIKKADKVLKKDESNAEAFFYKGGAYGFIGTIHVRNKSWIKAGIAAYKGIRALQKSWEIDPRMYDIYYGLGLYHCAAGNAPGIVRFVQKIIPIPEGDSELGLQYLEIALKMGTYTKTAAEAFLGSAYIYYEERYQDAIDILEPLVKKYPRCFDFWTSLANAYFYQGLTESRGNWTRLIETVEFTQKMRKERGIEMLPWWENKLLFMEGYARYSMGEYEKASSILSDYSKIYPDKGDSYLTSLGELTLGKIADLSGNREQAVEHYSRSLQLEHFGNLEKLAKHYIKEPFTGETIEHRFIGMKVDLPGRS
jgi:tetratricopeptide (TPR) repeat protein